MRTESHEVSGVIWCFASCTFTNAATNGALARGSRNGSEERCYRAAWSIHLRSKLALTPYCMAMRDTDTPDFMHSWASSCLAWRS